MINNCPFNTATLNSLAPAESVFIDWSKKLTHQTGLAWQPGAVMAQATRQPLAAAAAANRATLKLCGPANYAKAQTLALIRASDALEALTRAALTSAQALGANIRTGLRWAPPRQAQVRLCLIDANHTLAAAQLLARPAPTLTQQAQAILIKSAHRQAQTRLYLVPSGQILSKVDLWFRAAHRPLWGKHPPHPFEPPPPPIPKPGPKILPPSEHYQVSNSCSVTRIDTGHAIECLSLSIATDMQSWSRRFSGNVLYQDLDQISTQDGPVEIQITVNSLIFRAVITSYQDNRQFGQDSASFQAVSRSVELAKPYALAITRINDADANAYQLALALLEYTGWSLDWLAVDWLIPAGLFSLTNAAPMDGIKQIANAVGAFVLCDRRYQVLHVTPAHPVAPWLLASATPDITLPVDVATQVAGEWQENPRINGVWVSGQNAGVCALVRRDGTAGDVLGDMVVDPLLTATAANRARGIALLAESGARQPVSLTLGVYPEIGIIEPGQIVKVNDLAYDWVGVCQSNALNVAWQATGLDIKQTPVLLRWYG